MNFKYYYADNFGEGFITKEDSQFGSISGFTGNIYVTTNENWAKRVGAIEKTKEEAQGKSVCKMGRRNAIDNSIFNNKRRTLHIY